jgi:hypothetical protein
MKSYIRITNHRIWMRLSSSWSPVPFSTPRKLPFLVIIQDGRDFLLTQLSGCRGTCLQFVTFHRWQELGRKGSLVTTHDLRDFARVQKCVCGTTVRQCRYQIRERAFDGDRYRVCDSWGNSSNAESHWEGSDHVCVHPATLSYQGYRQGVPV